MKFCTISIILLLGLALLYYTQKARYIGNLSHTFKQYGNITIYREKETGIPHIHGKSLQSACFGQGYAHAQDRLFQMHMKRILGRGRLSEFSGKKFINLDKMFRQIGLSQIAKETVDKLKKETTQCLQAYSDGINNYADSLTIMPLDFIISRMQWEPWVIEDSIISYKMLTWLVSIDHVYEIIRTKNGLICWRRKSKRIFGMGSEYQFITTEILSDDELKLNNIYQKYEKIVNYPDIGQVLKDIKFEIQEGGSPGETPGSNSWVIGGQYTYSGKPLLVNDPHLPNNMPSVWYPCEILYEINNKQKSAIGVTIPGIPHIIIGKINFFAIGVTILMADISDYYIEKVDLEKQTYQVDNQWKSLKIINEEIKVKQMFGYETIQFTRYETHRGPLVQQIMSKKSKGNPLQQVPFMSFAWTGNDRDNSNDKFHEILQIENIQQLQNVLKGIQAPGCAVIYASESGDYGFIGIGKKPIRKNQRYGGFVKPGMNSDYDWQGYQKSSEWPQSFMPTKGFIVTANNKYSSDNIVHAQSINLFSTSRASRIVQIIEEKIQSKQKFSVQDMKDMQADTVDIFAQKVLPKMIEYFEENGHKVLLNNKQNLIVQNLLNQLKRWNYKIDPNSVEASIYSVWLYLFRKKTFKNNYFPDEDSRSLFVNSIHSDQFIYKKLFEFSSQKNIYVAEKWCQSELENCLEELYYSLYETHEYLSNTLGSDWRQGLLHNNQFPHHIFGQVPILNLLFNRKQRGYGNRSTIAVGIQEEYKDSFDSSFGSNYRQIIDFADNSTSYWIIDTGVSENIFSEYYDNQKPYYNGTQYHNHHKYGNITIYREKKHGIPHIKGNNIDSVCFGQGYVHAQDRAFTMSVKRLFASGRMSEYFGEKMINIDKMMREINIVNIARESVSTLNKQTKDCIQAYSDGINYQISTRSTLPIEFYIAGIKFEEWTIVDTIAQTKLLSWSVSRDHTDEIMRTKLAQIVGEEKAREYLGLGSENQFVNTEILSDEELKDSSIFEKYQKVLQKPDIGEILKDIVLNFKQYQNEQEIPGSNSWVISGNHTYSGKPLLCNDPHLGNTMPSIWQQNELLYMQNGKQKYAIGVTSPGIPGIIIGKYNFFSIGVTILYVDMSDYYYENIDFKQKKYKLDNKWVDLKVYKEVIKVKGSHSLVFDRYETHRGPITNYQFNILMPNPQENIVPMSFKWAGNDRVNMMNSLIQLLQVEKIEELIDLGKNMPEPWCSVVYASTQGDIGFIGVGNKPFRKNQRSGAFIKDGTKSQNDWLGYLKPNEQPFTLNPKKGYVVTANNKMATDNINKAISVNQFSTPRSTRIVEMIENQLKSKKKFTIEDMKQMQKDMKDTFAEKVIPGLISLFEKQGKNILNDLAMFKNVDNLIQRLKKWDYKIEPESTEASIYSVWLFLFTDHLMPFFNDQQARNVLTKSLHFDQFLFKKLKQFGANTSISFINEPWCGENKQSNCLQLLFQCLAETEEFLNVNIGQDWRKGIFHSNLYPHAFSKSPLGGLFDRKYRGFGNQRTVAVAVQKLSDRSFHSSFGANYRQILDMSEEGKSYYVIDTGISESIFSAYYDDQMKLHENFEYIEMKYGHDRINEYEMVLHLNQIT